MKFPYLIELGFTSFFWYPYIMYGEYEDSWQADYYGHKWFLMISIWVVEIIILKKLSVLVARLP